MSTVYAKPGESVESLLRRFKKVVERSGILSDLKKHEFYEKPSVQKKRKQAAARKREQKRQMKMGNLIPNRNLNFRFNKDHTQKIPLNKPKPNYQANNKPTNSSGEGYKKPYENRNNSNRPSGGEGYKKPYENRNSNYKKPYSNNRPNYKPQNKDRK